VLIDGDFSLAPSVDQNELTHDGALLVWSADAKTGAENRPPVPPGLQPSTARGVLTLPARSLLGKPEISIGWEILPGAP
jgi:hypothetical protein